MYYSSQEDPQPILHLINICPKCGFAAYTADFNMLDFDLQKIKQAIAKIEKFSSRKATKFNAGDGYLEINEYLDNLSLEKKLAIQLQASYAYRELKDENLKKVRQHILKTLEEILRKKAFNQNPEEFYLYLIGEIHRLLGNDKESFRYFKQILLKVDKNSLISKITQNQLSNPGEIIPNEIFKV